MERLGPLIPQAEPLVPTQNAISRIRRPRSGLGVHSVGAEIDDDVGWFGRLGHQTCPGAIVPARHPDNVPSRVSRFAGLGRFDDMKPVFADKERVIPEKFVQLRDCGMVVGKCLGFKLVPRYARPIADANFTGYSLGWKSRRKKYERYPRGSHLEFEVVKIWQPFRSPSELRLAHPGAVSTAGPIG